MTSLVVFTWSRSFETRWPDLATASGVALDLCVAEPGALPEWSSREDAVLLCAAGGMETDASAALERMAIGARLAIVGILGSSVALQASVARALPDVPRCHADHRLTAPRSPSAHAKGARGVRGGPGSAPNGPPAEAGTTRTATG